ncbi:hypothetical protein CVV70_22955 [Ralstonia solanacearum]|nr:hypothetical protein B5G54_13825 [Ralstonia solanacearum]OPK52150.1 hypothetical protein B5J95_18080 [Ralstonia solanacearum]OYQ02278.1 hypothetical protein B7R79_19115 [Ralstonia solanacearum]PNQ32392.1 hypothetical protein CVS51_09095 [Ralstonia solanacearum]PNQ41641.1 hypothetical protein CVT21_12125 [Ralstonia solanacearum]
MGRWGLHGSSCGGCRVLRWLDGVDATDQPGWKERTRSHVHRCSDAMRDRPRVVSGPQLAKLWMSPAVPEWASLIAIRGKQHGQQRCGVSQLPAGFPG